MDFQPVFKKYYDAETKTYKFWCNGIVTFSNIDLSEEEVRNNLEALE